jgi:hypothetical protein
VHLREPLRVARRCILQRLCPHGRRWEQGRSAMTLDNQPGYRPECFRARGSSGRRWGHRPYEAPFKWSGAVFRGAVIEEPGLGFRRARGVWREAMAVRQRLRISDALSHFSRRRVCLPTFATRSERSCQKITKVLLVAPSPLAEQLKSLQWAS